MGMHNEINILLCIFNNVSQILLSELFPHFSSFSTSTGDKMGKKNTVLLNFEVNGEWESVKLQIEINWILFFPFNFP